jgi:drug/metabolite transporter (DMT)-like permease
MKNIILFMLAVLIWGSTWLVITFQLGDVHPLVSVFYRFAIAAVILLIYAKWKNLFKPLNAKSHILLALQGICLFGINHWAVYQGEHYITSALAAVMSTSIIYLNILFGWILLGKPVAKEVLGGAIIGVLGIILLFLPELTKSEMSQLAYWGLGLVFVGSILASLGNITSAYTQQSGIAVTHANALSMSYATIFLALIIAVSDIHFSFSYTFEYISSLLYLAIFGSVIAFWAYLTLVGNIGADKAGYAVLVYPAIALILSSLYEDYLWTWQSFLGLGLIVFGNLIAMNKWQQIGLALRISKTRIRG